MAEAAAEAKCERFLADINLIVDTFSANCPMQADVVLDADGKSLADTTVTNERGRYFALCASRLRATLSRLLPNLRSIKGSLTPVHVRVTLPTESDSKRKHHGEDGNKELPGWAKVREPKDEPHIVNKNLHLGQWLSRASANSGPKIAPGVGIKKSS